MPKALAKSDGYKTLVQKITREFAELEFFVKSRVAQGHWNVGKYIHEHLLEHKDRADYGATFYERLAKDVGREKSTLLRSVQFYRTYPIVAAQRQLTWDHYKSLLPIKDAAERKKLEERIIRHGWNTKQFRKYLSVKRGLAAPDDGHKAISQLTFTRGKLHTYQIVPANKTLVQRGPLALDLGFREQYAIPQGAPHLKENDTVDLVSTSGGKDGTLAGVRKVSVAPEDLFTYVAMVEKVIDGDTLLVSFDFGFPVSVSWKLRLREIDCPEIDTEEGKRAKRFVESRLKDCDFIIVKTYKDRSDKFDRYLADVFYAPGASAPSLVAGEGTYLNQELLNEHLAVRYGF